MKAQRPAGTTPSPRAEQLRRAKREQRERERARGLVELQLKLPGPIAEKLRRAAREPEFASHLERWLESRVMRVSDYPALAAIAWNRHGEWISAREAFALYERNWRFVELAGLDARERQVVEQLAERFGAGLINA